jgi:hypothetical protein
MNLSEDMRPIMKKEVNCLHACRNSCALLNEALRKEAGMVKYYEGVYAECNFPEVQSFLLEMIEEKRQSILNIIKKLNEIHAHSQALDGIISSYDQDEKSE